MTTGWSTWYICLLQCHYIPADWPWSAGLHVVRSVPFSDYPCTSETPPIHFVDRIGWTLTESRAQITMDLDKVIIDGKIPLIPCRQWCRLQVRVHHGYGYGYHYRIPVPVPVPVSVPSYGLSRYQAIAIASSKYGWKLCSCVNVEKQNIMWCWASHSSQTNVPNMQPNFFSSTVKQVPKMTEKAKAAVGTSDNEVTTTSKRKAGNGSALTNLAKKAKWTQGASPTHEISDSSAGALAPDIPSSTVPAPIVKLQKLLASTKPTAAGGTHPIKQPTPNGTSRRPLVPSEGRSKARNAVEPSAETAEEELD